MEELSQYLPNDRREPRLWIERMVIFSEPDEAHIVRIVPFHRGLNVVWAKEPAIGNALGTRAAGHGVGKSSLCLLIRFCLGEHSKAVTQLRDELFGEFSLGGVVAVLHVNGQCFTLCRYFNAHKEGFACTGEDTVGIWTRETDISDRAFLKKLADDMMSPVSPRNIPETGQVIEWKHVLAWITRDQGSRFKSFFSWREDEGTGLQRGRKDPPIVMRSVLGLLVQAESILMGQVVTIEQELAKAKQKTAELLLEPVLIQRRIESSLRAYGNLPIELPIRSTDFFGDSVEQRIKLANEKSIEVLAQLEAQFEDATQEVANLRVNLKLLNDECAMAQAQYDLADAARRGDEVAFYFIGIKLAKLKNLAGHCEEGNLPFLQCRYVQEEMNKLQFSSMQDARDRRSLEKAIAESAGQANAALARVNGVSKKVAALRLEETSLLASRARISIKKRTAEIAANKWPALLEELERWERSSGSPEAQVAIDASLAASVQIEQNLKTALTRLALQQNERSEREKTLARIADDLTRQLLPDGAIGSFDPRDEIRPFRLSMRGGEAYRVLEVLLGDVACMLDSPRSESALPGLFIHDCPREADMSTGLYENFLLLIAGLQNQKFPDNEIPFQYIVTTTTPPPHSLQESSVCLSLDPSSDEGLLFGRRFVVAQQSAL